MANIQRGDERQYLPQAKSSIDFSGQYAKISENALDTGISVAQKANQSTLANNQIDLSTKFLAKNNEINTKYQADPTNPERERELREAFDSLSAQYRVNPLCQKQWSDIKNDVYNRYKTYNAQWTQKQQQTNASVNLKNGYEKLINNASMLGINGASMDEARLIYADGIQALKTGATPQLGEIMVEDALNSATHDYMASYLSALAFNNPLEAQQMLKREDVRNDIGRAETLQKLDDYVANSLSTQAKRTAVNELGNTLREMNSEAANDIISGKADLNKVMKFIETNKNLPEGSKDLILGIYGIGSKSEYIYDRDKKRIIKKEKSQAKSNSVSTPKMSPLQKKIYAETLEQDLHNLLSFSEDETVNIKDIKKNKNQQEASNFVVDYMKAVAGMQGKIDTAYSAGVIDKSTRNRLVNSYISPVSDYIESNLEQLDEGAIKGFGTKLGYDRIKKRFNTNDLKGKELQNMQKQKLFAQNYYLDELHKVVAKTPDLKNIYSIESLPSHQQQEIYKTASENAIKRAKRWTDKPEYFFAKEYPDIYSQPFTFFKQDEALMINRVVAETVYKMEFEGIDGKSTLDLKDFSQSKMIEEINKQAKINRFKAGDTLGARRDSNDQISAPDPKNYVELEKQLKNIGFSIKEFAQYAADNGYVSPKFNGWDWQKGYMSEGHIRAYRDLRHAKALKESRKK